MKTTLSLTLVTLGLLSGTANAANEYHIDDLAATLQRQTAQLTYEVQHQFRYTRDYKHLLKDSVEMEQLAKHIHDVAHFDGNQRHIASDVRKLDRLYHHIERLVNRMNVKAKYNSYDYYHGYNHGVAQTRQLKRIMRSIGRTLHHLEADLKPLRYRSRPRRIVTPPRPVFSFGF